MGQRGNSQSRSYNTQTYDFNNPDPNHPNPWENIQEQRKRQASTSPVSSIASSTSSCSSGRPTCSQRKAERRALREERRQARALARAERATRRRANGGGCGGCCGGKKKKMLTDMYFESLNSSLGPERSVEEVGPERIALEPSVSRHRGDVGAKRIEGANGNAVASYSYSHAGPVGEQPVEVPPPAYEEVMEQTTRKKN